MVNLVNLVNDFQESFITRGFYKENFRKNG